MTYAVFKNITTGLLTGDNVLPIDFGVTSGLIQAALTTTATMAESLHLMTLSTTADILRMAHGDYLIRRPIMLVEFSTNVDLLAIDATDEEIAAAEAADLVLTDTQPIDIDEELAFAVARFVASYISKDKGGIHVQAANRMILDYNAKTYEILEQMELEAAAAGTAELASVPNDTEWTL